MQVPHIYDSAIVRAAAVVADAEPLSRPRVQRASEAAGSLRSRTRLVSQWRATMTELSGKHEPPADEQSGRN